MGLPDLGLKYFPRGRDAALQADETRPSQHGDKGTPGCGGVNARGCFHRTLLRENTPVPQYFRAGAVLPEGDGARTATPRWLSHR